MLANMIWKRVYRIDDEPEFYTCYVKNIHKAVDEDLILNEQTDKYFLFFCYINEEFVGGIIFCKFDELRFIHIRYALLLKYPSFDIVGEMVKVMESQYKIKYNFVTIEIEQKSEIFDKNFELLSNGYIDVWSKVRCAFYIRCLIPFNSIEKCTVFIHSWQKFQLDWKKENIFL